MSALKEVIAKFDVEVNSEGVGKADTAISSAAKHAQELSAALAKIDFSKLENAPGGEVEIDDSGEKKIESLGDKLKSLAGAWLSVKGALAVKDFVTDQISAAAALDDTAQRLDVTTDELQKFQHAANMAGVESEAATTSLGFLQKNIGAALAEPAGESAKAFRSLGVSLKNNDGTVRETLDVVDDYAENISKLGSNAEKTAAVVKVFGRQGAALLPLFNSGSKGIRDAYDEFERLGGGMDSAFIKQAAEVDDEFERMGVTFKSVKSALAAQLLPTIKAGAHVIVNLAAGVARLAKHTNLLKGVLLALGVAGGVTLVKQLGNAAKALGLVQKAAGLSWESLASIGATAGPIIVGIGLLFLLLEDLYTLMTGGESVIGETLDELDGFGASAELVAELQSAWDAIKEAFDGTLPTLKEIGKVFGEVLLAALPYVIRSFVGIVKVLAAITQGFALLIESVKTLVETLGDVQLDPRKIGFGSFKPGTKDARDARFKKLDEKGSSTIDSIIGKTSSYIDPETGNVETRRVGGLFGGKAPSYADVTPPAVVAPSVVGAPAAAEKKPPVSVTAQTKIDVHVKATDPVEAGREASKGVSDAMSQKALRDALAAVPGG